ncbi:hypothetical protein [Acidovorax sp. Leaf160]|uniref:hypothetical protein n=1 Tax=Acidovorax sp. Leaf160 TaxID=1736280 RepID=UPI0006FBF433|nr:hypothetical protein [Acidovorax sp. Leaf160]KQR63179.1 hypothetical protein ASF94_01230 [Acidovorax sp. Leaf160]
MTTIEFVPPLPDAALFDIGEWPIVYARFPELDEVDRVPRTLRSLDAVLAQRQRFVIVWTPARHDHDDEPHEDERQSMVWLKARKGDLREWCAGYVYVTTDPALRTLLTSRFVTVSKLLPFPKLLADDRDDARRQALELLV